MRAHEHLLFGMDIPIARMLGITGQSLGNDMATVMLPYQVDASNSRGEIGGGAIATALDLALAASVRAHDPDNYSVSTVELTSHFLSSCTGDLTVQARCTRRGGRICFAQGEALDAAGRLVATASGVFVLNARSLTR